MHVLYVTPPLTPTYLLGFFRLLAKELFKQTVQKCLLQKQYLKIQPGCYLEVLLYYCTHSCGGLRSFLDYGEASLGFIPFEKHKNSANISYMCHHSLRKRTEHMLNDFHFNVCLLFARYHATEQLVTLFVRILHILKIFVNKWPTPYPR